LTRSGLHQRRGNCGSVQDASLASDPTRQDQPASDDENQLDPGGAGVLTGDGCDNWTLDAFDRTQTYSAVGLGVAALSGAAALAIASIAVGGAGTLADFMAWLIRQLEGRSPQVRRSETP
jgi:hypothetical protein